MVRGELARAPYDLLVVGGDIKLVREAHTERRALLRVVAPHLVRRLPFLFPVYRGGPYRPATIQAGLWSYSTLALERPRRLVGSRADRVLAPAAERPELLERIHPDAPDVAAQVVFAADAEWATSAEDVIHRRTTLAARGLAGARVVARVDGILGHVD